MNKEQKTDVLLQMMEQPEQYSEQQWLDILSDEECRELYTMMAMTQGAVDAAQADATLTEKETEEELMKVKNERIKSEKLKVPFFISHKVAAAFLAAAFLGGLTWAISPLLTSSKEKRTQPTQVTAPSLIGRAGGESSILFTDIRLDSMLTVVAQHYDKAVYFGNDELKGLRIHTRWNPEDSLAVFIESLNELDGLQLTEQRDTIFVQGKTHPSPFLVGRE